MTKRVIFELKTNDGTVIYPDDINFFGATDIETEPGKIIADYHGKLALTLYHPPGSQRPQLVITDVVSNKAELKIYRDMVATVSARVKKLAQEGKKLDEIIAAKPSAEYDERWGKGFIPTGRFIEMLLSAWAK